MFRKRASFILAVLLLVSIAVAGCKKNAGTPEAEAGDTVPWPAYMLRMEYVENFKIMQLADIQAPNVTACNNAFVDIKSHVDKEKPNLLVLTGDNVENPKSDDVFNAFISNMESLNVPWAPVFGNHDAEGVLTKEFMAEKFMDAEHCLFYKGAEGVDGVGNYVINLVAENKKIIYSLVLMDSQMYKEGGGYDAIHANQIEWYEEAVTALTEFNDGQVVPSLAFFHIPLREFIDAKASYERGESAAEFAVFNEPTFASAENTGFFSKAQALNSTKVIVCAHDHINTCDIDYLGIRLVYGLKSSRCSYYDSALLGTTVITLTTDTIGIRNSFFE